MCGDGQEIFYLPLFFAWNFDKFQENILSLSPEWTYKNGRKPYVVATTFGVSISGRRIHSYCPWWSRWILQAAEKDHHFGSSFPVPAVKPRRKTSIVGSRYNHNRSSRTMFYGLRQPWRHRRSWTSAPVVERLLEQRLSIRYADVKENRTRRCKLSKDQSICQLIQVSVCFQLDLRWQWIYFPLFKGVHVAWNPDIQSEAEFYRWIF